MGATFSYLGYASHQPRHSQSHEHISQQFHSSCGQTVVLGKEGAASLPIIDLCTRIGASEKDLELCRTENAKKEAVIQYLLQSSVSNTRISEITEKLKERLSALTTTIDRTNKEYGERLLKVEDSVYALSTRSILISGPVSTSTSFSGCSDCPQNSGVVAEDLIDLLDCSQESDSVKLMGDETTLLDQSCEEESNPESVVKNATPNQSLRQSSDSEFQDFPYIVHFTDNDEEGNPNDSVKVATKVRCPRIWHL